MKTNLENYEERFVDYMEGQLDATEMKEVEAFVALHPELEEDFRLFCSSRRLPTLLQQQVGTRHRHRLHQERQPDPQEYRDHSPICKDRRNSRIRRATHRDGTPVFQPRPRHRAQQGVTPCQFDYHKNFHDSCR